MRSRHQALLIIEVKKRAFESTAAQTRQPGGSHPESKSANLTPGRAEKRPFSIADIIKLGTWCSGITTASHAEGPGFKSQCVHCVACTHFARNLYLQVGPSCSNNKQLLIMLLVPWARLAGVRALGMHRGHQRPFWELRPGPRAPEARIIPLDQTANCRSAAQVTELFSCVSRGGARQNVVQSAGCLTECGFFFGANQNPL